MTVDIRPARLSDAEAMWEILYQDEARQSPSPPRRQPPIAVEHHIETGSAFVAVEEGRVVGFVSGITRDACMYVSFLFIDPSYQADSVGKRLLGQLLEHQQAERRHILSSHNFAALSLYLRHGFRPVSQMAWTYGASEALAAIPSSDVTMTETDVDNPVLQQWDLECSGVRRPQDFHHWAKAQNGRFFLFEQAGETIGYGVARIDTPAVFARNQVTCGPIGAAPGRQLEVMEAFLKWAAGERPLVRANLFLPNPALPQLLEHGMRIEYLNTYLADGQPVLDVTRYCPADWEL